MNFYIDGLKCKFEGYRISRTGFLDVYLDSVSGIASSDLMAIVNFAENADPEAVGIYVYVPHISEYDEPQASLIYDFRSRIWKAKPTKLRGLWSESTTFTFRMSLRPCYHREYVPFFPE